MSRWIGWVRRQEVRSLAFGALALFCWAYISFQSVPVESPLQYNSHGTDSPPFGWATELDAAPIRRQLGQSITDVTTASQLLAALRNVDVSVIRLTSAYISLDTPDWIGITTPLILSRSVTLLGGGRYDNGGSAAVAARPDGPHNVLDCSHLVERLQLAASGSAAAGPVSLQFRGVWLRNHLPPTGYAPLLLAPSPPDAAIATAAAATAAIVNYDDCVLERFVGEQLHATAAEVAAVPAVIGQPPHDVQELPGPWCPPPLSSTVAAAAQPVALPCFTGTLSFKHFAVQVWPVCPQPQKSASLGNGTAPTRGSLSTARCATRQPTNASAPPPTLVVLASCTYGVQYSVAPACVDAYGADPCIYQLQAQLRAIPGTAAGGGGSGGGGLSSGAAAGIAVVATLCGCLALVLLVRFWRRIRDGHRTLTLAVRPPGATPLTTLLVTDIQNSTNLWEQLPTAVMNEALRLHHRCLRGLLLKCNGYESATEGDSFILAFHSCLDAARFALLAQAALLELPWPHELLEHEDGREVWAEPARPKMLGAGRTAGLLVQPRSLSLATIMAGTLSNAGGHHHHHRQNQHSTPGVSANNPNTSLDGDGDSQDGDLPCPGGKAAAADRPSSGAAATAQGWLLARLPSRRGGSPLQRPPSLRLKHCSRSFTEERPSGGRLLAAAGAPDEVAAGRRLRGAGAGSHEHARFAVAAAEGLPGPSPPTSLGQGSVPHAATDGQLLLHMPPPPPQQQQRVSPSSITAGARPPAAVSDGAALRLASTSAAAGPQGQPAQAVSSPLGSLTLANGSPWTPDRRGRDADPEALARSALPPSRAGEARSAAALVGRRHDGTDVRSPSSRGPPQPALDPEGLSQALLAAPEPAAGQLMAYESFDSRTNAAAAAAAAAAAGRSTAGGRSRSTTGGSDGLISTIMGSLSLRSVTRTSGTRAFAAVAAASGATFSGGGGGGGEGEAGSVLFPGWAGVARGSSHLRPSGSSPRLGSDLLSWAANPLALLPPENNGLEQTADDGGASHGDAFGPVPGADVVRGLRALPVVAATAAKEAAARRPPAPVVRAPVVPSSKAGAGAGAASRGSAARPVAEALEEAPSVLEGGAPWAAYRPTRGSAGPVAEGLGEVPEIVSWAATEEEDLGSVILVPNEDTQPPPPPPPPPPAETAAAESVAAALATGVLIGTHAVHRKASFGSSAPMVPSRLGPRSAIPTSMAPQTPFADAFQAAPPAGAPGAVAMAAGALAAAGSSDSCGGGDVGGGGEALGGGQAGSPLTELQMRQLGSPSALLLSRSATSELLALLTGAGPGAAGGGGGVAGSGALSQLQSHTAAAAAAAAVNAAAAAANAVAHVPTPLRGQGALLRVRTQPSQELLLPSAAAEAVSVSAAGGGNIGPRLTPPCKPLADPTRRRAGPLRAPAAPHPRAHTVHGYSHRQAARELSGPQPGAEPRGSGLALGAMAGSEPLVAPFVGAGAGRPSSSRSLLRSRTQALEMIPLPDKVPEVRQTWRALCASNWPLVVAPLRINSRHRSNSLDLPYLGGAAGSGTGALEPHQEADGGDDDEQQDPPPHPPHNHHHHTHHHVHHHLHLGLHHSHHNHGRGSKTLKGAVLLFRGCRVRMGLHSGIPLTTDVTFNHTTGHMAYSGMPLKVAKAVGDAAAGGSVLLSNTAYNQLHPHLPELPNSPEAHFCGDAQIELVIRSLYMLVSKDQRPRLGYLAPLRNLRFLQTGNLDAPVGTVAICFMMVSGATKAVAELGQPAVSALQQFKSIVTRECCDCGGFVVEATDGLCLAAFMEPAAAAIWALRCKEALSAHNWSHEVLSSPHFREVRDFLKIHRGRGVPSRRVANVVCRGPRIRTGIAVGSVTAEVSTSTARLSYRGKVMNRSARVASQAADNQVLLSDAAWQRIVSTAGVCALVTSGFAFPPRPTTPQSDFTLPYPQSPAATLTASGLAPVEPGPASTPGPVPDAAGDLRSAGSRTALPSPHFHHLFGAGAPAALLQQLGSSLPTSALASPCVSPLPSATRPLNGLSGTAPVASVSAAPAVLRPSVSGGCAAAAAAAADGGGNPLLAAANQLLSDAMASVGGDADDAEQLVAAAVAVGKTLPALPSGFVLTGRSAGRFTLKGVSEPQELYDVRMEAVKPQPVAAPEQQPQQREHSSGTLRLAAGAGGVRAAPASAPPRAPHGSSSAAAAAAAAAEVHGRTPSFARAATASLSQSALAQQLRAGAVERARSGSAAHGFGSSQLHGHASGPVQRHLQPLYPPPPPQQQRLGTEARQGPPAWGDGFGAGVCHAPPGSGGSSGQVSDPRVVTAGRSAGSLEPAAQGFAAAVGTMTLESPLTAPASEVHSPGANLSEAGVGEGGASASGYPPWLEPVVEASSHTPGGETASGATGGPPEGDLPVQLGGEAGSGRCGAGLAPPAVAAAAATPRALAGDDLLEALASALMNEEEQNGKRSTLPVAFIAADGGEPEAPKAP